jgi:fatty-acyl-CoA synthase
MLGELRNVPVDPLHATVAGALDAAADGYGARGAVLFQDLGLTYAELRERADRLAAGLAALGLRKGEHVAVWLPNGLEWVVVELAIARLGLVLVPISTRYKRAEAEYILRQSDAVALVLADRFLRIDFLALLDELAGGRFRGSGVASCPSLRHVIVHGERVPPGSVSLAELGGERPLARADHPVVLPQDPFLILYTSGTTGFPKGATLSHRNVVYNTFHMAERMRLDERDRILLMPPLFHVFGCVNGVVAAISHASSVVVQELFEPGDALTLLERHACTAVYGTATMFQMLLDHADLDRGRRPALRTGMIGSMPVPDTVMRGVVERLAAPEICNSYGQTEASVSLLTEAGAGLDVLLRGVGPPVPGVELRVVDPGTDRDVAPGEDGEIRVRGPHLMLGYYKMSEKSAEAVDPDGWLRSGDLGRQVGPGLYRITGRIKDMYITGGLKVYPAEVENILYRHPAVVQVAIVGVPDERLGEVGHAFVQSRPGEQAGPEDMIDFVRARLAGYKAPRFVTFVDEYPTTANGKIQKFRLRDQAARARAEPDRE